MKDFIYLELAGTTASFKIPQIYQGYLLSLPVPPYSTILGILSNLIDREVKPEDTRIGFKYTYEGIGTDLEKYHRWERKPTGSYSYNKTAVRSRQFHYKPRLKIILDNLELHDQLQKPKRIITLGRSQDIAYIDQVTRISAKNINEGVLNHTLVRLDHIKEQMVNGLFFNLPEYFDYKAEYVRQPRNIVQFFAIGESEASVSLPHLYQVENEIFHLHEWGELV